MTALSDVFLKVRPDTTGFPEELKAKLAAELRDFSVAVKLKADTKELDAQLAKLSSKEVSIKVKYDTPAGGAPGGSRGFGGGGSSGFLGGGGLNQIQAALLGLAGLGVTPLTASVVGLGAAFATTGAAVGAFGTAAVGHIAQLTDVLKQVNEEGQQLNTLPAPFQRLIPVVQQFQTSWGMFLQNTRGPVFDVFIRGLTVTEGLLQRAVPIVNIVSTALGSSLDRIGSFATGPEVQQFLAVVGSSAPEAIRSLTQSATNLGSGLLRIFTGFAPSGQTMLHTIEQLTDRFSRWTSSLVGSSEFQRFLDYVNEHGPQVLTMLGDLASTVGNLVAGLAPVGAVTLDVASAFAKLLSVISPEWWFAIATAIAGVWAAVNAGSAATAVISGMSGVLKTLQGAWATLTSFIALATDAEVGFAAALSALTISELVTGIGAIVVAAGVAAAAIYALTQNTEDNTAADQDAITKGRELAQVYKDQGKAAAEAKLRQQIADDPKLQKQIDLYLKLGGSIDDYIKAQSGDVEAQKRVDAVYDNVIAKRRELDKQLQEGKITGAQFTQGLKDLGLGANDTVQSLEEQKNAFDASSKSMQTSNRVLAAYDQATNAASGATSNFAENLKNLVPLVDAYDQALRASANAKYNESQVAKQTAAANVQAARQVQDAEHSLGEAQHATREAQDRLSQSVKDLAKARADAAKALEDQTGKEHAAFIANERAKAQAFAIGLQVQGPITPEWQLRQLEIADNLKATTSDLARSTAEGNQLRQQGIEGSPGVVAAHKAVADAQKGVADAKYNEAKAQQAVNDAYTNQTTTLENGRHAREQAHQATLDAEAAERKAKDAIDATNTSLEDQAQKAGVSKDKLDGLRGSLSQALIMDASNPLQQLRDMAAYMEALQTVAAQPTRSWQDAWQAAQVHVNNPGNFAAASHRAFGGLMLGPGTDTSDSIPAWLSTGEFVHSAKAVRHYGVDFMKALNNMEVTKLAHGGSIDEIIGVAQRSGIPFHYPDNSQLTGGHHAPGSYHYKSMAVDFGTAQFGKPSVEKLAQYFMDNYGTRLIEEIHSPSWFIKNGRKVGPYGPASAHYNHLHVAAASGFTQGITAATSALAASTASNTGSTNYSPFLQPLFKELKGSFLEGFANSVFAPFTSGAAPTGAGGGGNTVTGTLGDWINKAIQLTGVPASWAGGKGLLGLYTLIMRESGGNPHAINLWDSNARAGHPSKGLMQTIPSTFAAHHQPGTSNDIFDPVANIAAGINYIKARYHDISNVQQADPNRPPKGYDSGGWLTDKGINTSGKPEAVLTNEESRGLKAMVGGNGTVRLDDYTLDRLAQRINSRPSRLALDGKDVTQNVSERLGRELGDW